MEQLTNAALGLHVVRTPTDPPEWDLIRPQSASARHSGRRRRRGTRTA